MRLQRKAVTSFLLQQQQERQQQWEQQQQQQQQHGPTADMHAFEGRKIFEGKRFKNKPKLGFRV